MHIPRTKTVHEIPFFLLLLEYLRINIIFCPKLFRLMLLYVACEWMSVCVVCFVYVHLTCYNVIPQFKGVSWKNLHTFLWMRQRRRWGWRWGRGRWRRLTNRSSCRVVTHSKLLLACNSFVRLNIKPKCRDKTFVRGHARIIPKHQTYDS